MSDCTKILNSLREREELANNLGRDVSISTTALTRRHFATPQSHNHKSIYLRDNWRLDVSSPRDRSSARVNKAKVEEKGRDELRARERDRERGRVDPWKEEEEEVEEEG